LIDRDAELLVRDDTLKLRLGRLWRIVHDDGQSADEAVAGSQSGREHLKIVRELFGEELSLMLELLLQQ
jgi:hypothetical protein